MNLKELEFRSMRTHILVLAKISDGKVTKLDFVSVVDLEWTVDTVKRDTRLCKTEKVTRGSRRRTSVLRSKTFFRTKEGRDP